jgi:hypothetical protein
MKIKANGYSYNEKQAKMILVDSSRDVGTNLYDVLPVVPDNSNNNPINSMQYFHTAVLIKEQPDNSTCVGSSYKELVAYSVRTAKDINDMRDTLVRELEKGIVTSDCKFLISNIF